MTESTDIVKSAHESLDGITPGTWEADLDPTGSTRGIWPTEPNEEIIIGAYVAADGFESQGYFLGTDENLRFIAAAPDLVARVARRGGEAAQRLRRRAVPE